jgi:aminoglycoside/choline kinase family phosphotransferase
MMTTREALIEAFLARAGWAGAVRETLAADASFRSYDRIRLGARRAVLMNAPPEHEDIVPFIALARHLRGLGYSAPEPIEADVDAGLLLLEDLGDDTFTRLLAGAADERALYLLAVDLLIDLHRRPPGEALFEALPPYDDAKLLEEAALLIDWFVPAALGGTLDADARDAYLDTWRALLTGARDVPETLVLRDYHVDNLMRIEGRAGVAACGLLDFQDAVAGPVSYDFVSLVEDARRDVPGPLAAELRRRYLDALPQIDAAAFDRSCAILGAQRHCKVIGIFTRLCVRDGKPGYLGHIPRVWRLLETSLAHPALAELGAWLDAHVPPDKRAAPPAGNRP